MTHTITKWPERGQVVITNDQTGNEATVSIGPTGELISVDNKNGDNKYIGYSAERAKKAVEEIVGE